MNKDSFEIAVEFVPPYTPDASVVLKQIEEIKSLGVTTVSICSNPGGRPRLPSIYVADLIGDSMRRIIHYPCSGRSCIIFQSDMMAAALIGVDAVLLMHGDPHPECSYKVNMVDRIRMLKAHPASKDILIGCAADTNTVDKRTLDKLKAKIDAGVDYIQTQPIFDSDTLYKFLESTKELDIPILIGVMCPSKRSQLDAMMQIPGVFIPENYVDRFKNIPNDGVFTSNAVAQAKRLINYCRDEASGVYLSVHPSQLRYFEDVLNDPGVQR